MPKKENTGESASTETPTLPEIAPMMGLKLYDDLSYEEWVGELKKLQEVKKYWNAYLGDAVRFGRRKYGDKLVDSTLTQLEFNFSEVRKSEVTASIPIDRRTEFSALNTEHFYVVGKKVEGEKEQEAWLKTAVKAKLTGKELELSIEKGDRKEPVKLNTDQDTSGRGSGGIRTIEAAMHEVTLWMEMIGDDWQDWKVNHRKEFLDLTKDFANLRNEVAMSLEE